MADMPSIPTLTVTTPPCILCYKVSEVSVTKDAWSRYRAGALAQVAFPEMDVDDRELLINGTHPECWKAMVETAETEGW